MSFSYRPFIDNLDHTVRLQYLEKRIKYDHLRCGASVSVQTIEIRNQMLWNRLSISNLYISKNIITIESDYYELKQLILSLQGGAGLRQRLQFLKGYLH